MSLLDIDIGSSSCKAIVFTVGGTILAKHIATYSPDFPQPGFAEMDPNQFWLALCAACHAVTASLSEPVQALCLSSHGETFVTLDSDGRPLAPAILNQDNRATDETSWCVQTIGPSRLFQITGLIGHPMYPLPKIVWLRKHQPDVFASTATFVTLIGYLLHRMGLPPYVDFSLASRFMAFDIENRRWSDEILSAVGLTIGCLPVAVPAGSIVGKLSAEVAATLGISAGTAVVLGGHDQPCGALGSGVVSAGRVSDSIGTYECLVACSDAPSISELALSASLNSYCHVVPEKYVNLAYFPSGIMVKWFHDLLYANDCETIAAEPTQDAEAQHYAFLERNCPKQPTGLCITPHLIGTCNPEFNPHVRAAITGLAAGTTRNQVYKGILEGLACELSLITEVLAKAVGPFQDIYVAGGGSRSTLGLQLRAAMTRRRLHLLTQQEAVCLGTAMLAATAVGEFRNLSEAAGELVKETTVLEPEDDLFASYRQQQQRYRLLRSAMVAQLN